MSFTVAPFIRKPFLGAAALSLLFVCVSASAEPDLSKERVILKTSLGDLVFVLYPKIAPVHTKQFLELVKHEVYDHAFVYMVDPSLFIQVCDVKDKGSPLTPAGAAAIHKLKGEFSSEALHKRGALVMARNPEDNDSAETSFIILLRDAPELDGNNTVFGRVESGLDVLDAMTRIPRNEANRPKTLIYIQKALVAHGPVPSEKNKKSKK